MAWARAIARASSLVWIPHQREASKVRWWSWCWRWLWWWWWSFWWCFWCVDGGGGAIFPSQPLWIFYFSKQPSIFFHPSLLSILLKTNNRRAHPRQNGRYLTLRDVISKTNLTLQIYRVFGTPSSNRFSQLASRPEISAKQSSRPPYEALKEAQIWFRVQSRNFEI